MIELLTELAHNFAYLFWAMINGIGRAGVISSYFIRDTFRAHFNLIAQYTAPFEQEILDIEPPRPRNLNILGQIALTIFPLTILSWLAALTIGPLLYNSALLAIVGFARTMNLALFDLAEKQIKIPEGTMPWYRVLFGVPGLILGGTVGLVAAGAIGFGRILVNSFESALHSFVSVTNLALEQDDKIEKFSLEKDNRKAFKTYGFGLPGVVLGSLAGVPGFAAAVFGRIAINSYKTAKGLTVSAINVVRRENERLEATLEQDNRRAFLKYGLGLPGLVIGSLTAAAGLSLAALQRSALESWKTTKTVFRTIVDKASPARVGADQSELELVAERLFIDQYIYGAPGLFLGALSGSIGFAAVTIGHVFSHSYKTAKGLTVSAINTVQHENEQLEESLEQDERSEILKYGFGLPGLVIGSLSAAVGLTLATLHRSFIESLKTGSDLYTKIVQKASPEVERNVEEEPPVVGAGSQQRSRLDYYVFGAPGLIVGSLAGGLGLAAVYAKRVVSHSIESAIHSFASVTNLALANEDRIERFGLDRDERRASQIYGFGFPGVVLGGLAGAFGFVGAGLGRMAVNSYETARGLTISGLNLVRHNQRQDDLLHDGRPILDKYVFGFPGLIIGSLSAFLAMTISSFDNVRAQSWKTAKEVFRAFVRQALPAESEQDQTNLLANTDRRSFVDRYVFGAPGLVLGAIAGSFGFSLIGLGRIGENSYKTARGLTVSAMNVVRHENEQLEATLEQDNRRDSLKYGLGFPGLVVGSLTAAAGLSLAVLQRSAVESWKTTKTVFSTIVAQALPAPARVEPPEPELIAERSFIDQYLFGAPGLLVGALSGSVGFAALMTGRVLSNSYKTAKGLTISAINTVRHENEKLDEALERDDRSNQVKYGLGLPGLVIGSVSAAVGLTLATLQRGVVESLKTAKESYAAIVNPVQPIEEELDRPQPEPRSWVDRHVFGAAGYLAGGLVGGAVYVGRGLGQVFKESFDTGTRMFATIANAGLDENERFPYQELEHDETRSWQVKYLLGAPGVAVGAVLGSVTLAGIGAVKLATHNFNSWRSLSGSILNGSLESAYFGGMAADKRSDNAKYAGIAGYALAVLTALPLGILIFTFKKVIPVVLGLMLGVLSSPIVAAVKAIKQASSEPRFEEERVTDEKEQRFKNIYSSLTPWGQLAENNEIQDGQNGRKGPAAFTRKALTFNTSTSTEYTLDRLLTGYRESEDKERFFEENGEFTAILEEVKAHYKKMSCMESQQHGVARDEQIENLGAFVKDYVLGKRNSVPEQVYLHPKRSWTSTFWGVGPASRQTEELPITPDVGLTNC